MNEDATSKWWCEACLRHVDDGWTHLQECHSHIVLSEVTGDISLRCSGCCAVARHATVDEVEKIERGIKFTAFCKKCWQPHVLYSEIEKYCVAYEPLAPPFNDQFSIHDGCEPSPEEWQKYRPEHDISQLYRWNRTFDPHGVPFHSARRKAAEQPKPPSSNSPSLSRAEDAVATEPKVPDAPKAIRRPKPEPKPIVPLLEAVRHRIEEQEEKADKFIWDCACGNKRGACGHMVCQETKRCCSCTAKICASVPVEFVCSNCFARVCSAASTEVWDAVTFSVMYSAFCLTCGTRDKLALRVKLKEPLVIKPPTKLSHAQPKMPLFAPKVSFMPKVEEIPPPPPAPVVDVNWEIIPAFSGVISEEDKKRVLKAALREKDGKESKPKVREIAMDRIAFFAQIAEPKLMHFIRGIGSFSHYFGAQFTDFLVAFENIHSGNAIYVMFNNWQELSKLSKTELIASRNEGLAFVRVVHSKNWKERCQNVLRDAAARKLPEQQSA